MPTWLQVLVGVCSIMGVFLSIAGFLILQREKRNMKDKQDAIDMYRVQSSQWTMEERLILESRLTRLERITDLVQEYMGDVLLQHHTKRR